MPQYSGTKLYDVIHTVQARLGIYNNVQQSSFSVLNQWR